MLQVTYQLTKFAQEKSETEKWRASKASPANIPRIPQGDFVPVSSFYPFYFVDSMSELL